MLWPSCTPVALRIETPGDVKVHCDPLDMSEILANLIDNGCKWAANEVVVAWRQVGDRVEISVDDDGIGIPADKREQVLIVSERLDDTVSGTGLGLAIANELCIIHEGEMELGDSPLGGLRVTVRLPVLGDQRGIR